MQHTCVSCFNSMQDGNETGTDCGGACHAKCPIGDKCNTGCDCLTGLCQASDNTSIDLGNIYLVTPQNTGANDANGPRVITFDSRYGSSWSCVAVVLQWCCSGFGLLFVFSHISRPTSLHPSPPLSTPPPQF
jgi:hypothetical protein